MAIHLPLYPYGLGSNKAYLFIQEDFSTREISEWSIMDLHSRFGRYAVNQLLETGCVVKLRNERVQLSFKVLGSIPNLVLKFVSNEVLSFNELLHKFPKYTRCSVGALKNYVVYLSNFKVAQFFHDPITSITYIAIEGSEKTEQTIDAMHSLTPRLEPEFIYEVDSLEEVRELTSLSFESV